MLQTADGVAVAGLSQAEVQTMAEAERMMRAGAANRAVAATKGNEHSSRSHLVFSVYLKSSNKANGETLLPHASQCVTECPLCCACIANYQELL